MGLLKRWKKQKEKTKSNMRQIKKLMKDSGYKRGKDFDYIVENKMIKIVFEEEELKERVLKSLDSSIEWGLRQTNTR